MAKQSDEEDWECKACDEDDEDANDFIGCDTSLVPHLLFTWTSLKNFPENK